MRGLPLPKARSGNFATVYKVISQGRAWAVRCFTRAIPPDQQRRYTAISRAVTESGLPYFVGFNYLAQGIKVGSQWFPIVKMEWVSGEPLDSYIQRRLTAPAALAELADAWLDMTVALERAGIAHGDLQHGNVLVVNGMIRLVDYDGMFVPSLAGSRACEVGHRNYQHPLRNADHFGAWLDHFSAWVVFVSLIGLAADSSLWRRHKGGDDCLLFRREDFQSPERSAVLNDLISLPNGRARAAAAVFRSLVALPPDQIPVLNLGRASPPPRVAATQGGALPSWIKDHRLSANDPVAPFGAPSDSLAGGGAAWIVDHLAANTSERLDWGSVALLRGIIGLSSASAAVLSFLISPHILHWSVAPLLVGLFNVAALRIAYRRSVPFRELAGAAQKESEVREEMRGVELAIQKTETKVNAAMAIATAAKQKRASEIAKLEASRDARLYTARIEHKAQFDAHAEKLRKVAQEELREFQRATTTASLQLARAQQELSDLIRRENSQLQQELVRLQKLSIDDELRRTLLDHVPTGSRYLDLLRMSGIRSAYDATDERVASVYGVGPKTEAYIQRWRADVVNRARGRATNALPSAAEAQIRGRFAQERARLQGAIAALSQQQASNVVKNRFDNQRLALDVELRNAIEVCQARERTAIADHTQEVKNIDAVSQTRIEALDAVVRQLQAALAAKKKQQLEADFRLQRAVRKRELLERANFTAYLKRIFSFA